MTGCMIGVLLVCIKEFEFDTYDVYEQDQFLSISTTCVFPAMQEYMDISWYTYEEKKQEKRTVVSRLPLFSSFNDNEKRSIADAMDFKHMVRNATTSVDMLCKLHVITNGELYVTERGKTFGNSCAVVNAFKLSMRPTSDVTKVLPILREETRRKYNIHMLPTNTNFSATDEIKLLVMGLEQYNNILMVNVNKFATSIDIALSFCTDLKLF
ncbi:hypothetical protein MAR_021565 [Mya arenaria]|uniref:Uncharacterized protein n=1 Tax=Mya arenaria TaxID=6604 RepID=A0ABY7EC02_MYAAR|nr:hypothetical protein MAR_021565 [Mya arenaria]